MCGCLCSSERNRATNHFAADDETIYCLLTLPPAATLGSSCLSTCLRSSSMAAEGAREAPEHTSRHPQPRATCTPSHTHATHSHLPPPS
jgi:hypothetical protein